MSTPNQINHQNKLKGISEIIRAIEDKSGSENYIYRGEPKHYGRVTSSLYREYIDVEVEHFDIEAVQAEILSEAKRYTGKTDPFEILAEIHRYGGKTNLIEFTTDYRIALFFACDGSPGDEGRIILQRTEEIKEYIKAPRHPTNRVKSQKIIFVQPPLGFVEPSDVVVHSRGSQTDYARAFTSGV